jgi:hypothetical protein
MHEIWPPRAREATQQQARARVLGTRVIRARGKKAGLTGLSAVQGGGPHLAGAGFCLAEGRVHYRGAGVTSMHIPVRG